MTINNIARSPVGADLSRPPPIYRPRGNLPHPHINLFNFILAPILETNSRS